MFTARCYASAVLAMGLCLSVIRSNADLPRRPRVGGPSTLNTIGRRCRGLLVVAFTWTAVTFCGNAAGNTWSGVPRASARCRWITLMGISRSRTVCTPSVTSNWKKPSLEPAETTQQSYEGCHKNFRLHIILYRNKIRQQWPVYFGLGQVGAANSASGQFGAASVTVRIAPRLFFQVLVLLAEEHGGVRPVIYGLLPNQTAMIYHCLLDRILRLRANISNMNPDSISCDYEIALFNMVSAGFPNAEIFECFFLHFAKNLKKCINSKHLAARYNADALGLPAWLSRLFPFRT